MHEPDSEAEHEVNVTTPEAAEPRDGVEITVYTDTKQPDDHEEQAVVSEGYADHPVQVGEAVAVAEQPIVPPAEPLVAPVVAPATAAPAVPAAATQNSGGSLVLQWLSYAFWFWFSISLSILAGVVINYFISGSKDDEWSSQLAYPLASVIIMLIIALVTDRFYAKHEPAKKTGSANVIMLLHVVPFILIAIGSLVTIVFSLISMFLNSDPLTTTDGPIQVMLVAFIVALLFGLVAARAFYGNAHNVRRITWIAAIVLAIGFIVAAFVGPAADALVTKNDRLIERTLPSLASDIRTYTSDNNALPQKITDVTHDSSSTSDGVQKLIDSGLVTYKANTVKGTGSTYNPGDLQVESCVTNTTTGECGSAYSTRHYYQLCTTYKREKKSAYNYTDDAGYTTGNSVGSVADYNSSYLMTISSHPAGDVCYNLYADTGGRSEIMPLNE